ncbi:MAG: TetR/AcrR family transcriptional regulator, partial [Hyphomonadaceae bacterium]
MSGAAEKSLSRGERTRAALLDLAEIAVLEKGYAATSIEELIAAAGITKSGFFYHFREKADLAKALLRRDNAAVEAGLREIFAAAVAAHDDPLEALLFGLKLYAQIAAKSPASRPGCLAAAFSYQDALFDDEARALIAEGLAFKHRTIRVALERVAAARPPRAPVDLDALADMALAVTQGGMILDRVRPPEESVLDA